MAGSSCGNCGSELVEGAPYCGHCGAPAGIQLQTQPPYPSLDDQFAQGRYGWPQPTLPSQPPQPAQQDAQALATPIYVHPVQPGPTEVDPLVGAASPNQTYLGGRLAYTDNQTDFSPLTNPALLRSLAARLVAVIFTWSIGAFLLFLIFGIAGLSQIAGQVSSFSDQSASSSSGVLTTWLWLNVIWSIVLLFLFWLVKVPAQLSEWMLTVDGKGGSALAALDHMYAIIQARRTPIGSIAVVQVSPTGQAPRDYLEMVSGLYRGWVASFAYGSDLFIGWTFWVSISPARWVLMNLGQIWRGITLRQSSFYGGLSNDTAKAMREVMHSAVRQGVDMASEETAAVGQGVIGYSVPVVAVQG